MKKGSIIITNDGYGGVCWNQLGFVGYVSYFYILTDEYGYSQHMHIIPNIYITDEFLI